MSAKASCGTHSKLVPWYLLLRLTFEVAADLSDELHEAFKAGWEPDISCHQLQTAETLDQQHRIENR